MTTKPKFTEGEKVLCFHGPLIYEAKILKSQIKDKQFRYLVHYAGWSKNWDELVPESRVLKYNEANVQLQKSVSKSHSENQAVKSKKSTSKAKKSDVSNARETTDSRSSTPSKEVTKDGTHTPSAPSTSGRGRPLKISAPTAPTPLKTNTPTVATSAAQNIDNNRDDGQRKTKRARIDASSSTVETEEQFLSKVEVKIKIPDELKQMLVDDWDSVTRQHKLIKLPCKTTIQDIVDSYITYKKSSKSNTPAKECAITDVANGLMEYFNVMVGPQLLYNFERLQHTTLIRENPQTPMSKVYGAFHLLRLFVRLGSKLAFTALDEKSIQNLMVHVNDFLKFLIKNSSQYFNTNTYFANASQEYERKA